MNIRLAKLQFDEETVQEASDYIRQGRTTEGEEIAKFEENFARITRRKYCVATSSGTAALLTIFLSIPPKPVVTTPLTYMATVNVLRVLRYSYSFRDVNMETFGITGSSEPDGIILPVHLFGHPAKTEGLVIDDACEAVGSTLPDAYASAYSFYPSHTIGIGEMGAITTDDEELAKTCRLVKDNGRDRKAKNAFYHPRTGLNMKSNDVMALLANSKLKILDWIVSQRQSVARRLHKALGGRFNPASAYLGFPLVFPTNQDREAMVGKLVKAGVEVRRFFPVIETGYPIAQMLSANGLYLPCHEYLTNEEVEYMISVAEK